MRFRTHLTSRFDLNLEPHPRAARSYSGAKRILIRRSRGFTRVTSGVSKFLTRCIEMPMSRRFVDKLRRVAQSLVNTRF